MTLPPRIVRKRKRDSALRCPQHRQWIRTFACCVPECNSESRIDACHVRNGSHAGMGRKPGDDMLISMCRDHHREQHQIGEAEFERRYGLNLTDLAREFASTSPPLKRLRASPPPAR